MKEVKDDSSKTKFKFTDNKTKKTVNIIVEIPDNSEFNNEVIDSLKLYGFLYFKNIRVHVLTKDSTILELFLKNKKIGGIEYKTNKRITSDRKSVV